MQAVAIFDKDKVFPIVDGASEKGWRFDNGEDDLPNFFCFSVLVGLANRMDASRRNMVVVNMRRMSLTLSG